MSLELLGEQVTLVSELCARQFIDTCVDVRSQDQTVLLPEQIQVIFTDPVVDIFLMSDIVGHLETKTIRDEFTQLVLVISLPVYHAHVILGGELAFQHRACNTDHVTRVWMT